MLFDPSILAMIALAAIFAGISKAGFGSGVAFASASILALVLDPAVALAVMLPLLMLIDLASLPAYWRKWDWSAARVLLIGAVPGTLAGAVFFAVADPDVIRFMIGIVAIGFVIWQGALAAKITNIGGKPMGARAGYMAGLVLGFTSFVSHAGGPAAAVYLLGRRLNKLQFQATTVLVFWLVNLLKSVIYAQLGVFNADALTVAILLSPAAFFGAWLGIKAHHLISERAFFAVAYTALLLTGAKLIWDALT